MADQTSFVAREYVRTYSDGLRSIQSPDSGDTSPRERLESALKDEIERQDALTALIQQAFSRFVEPQFNEHGIIVTFCKSRNFT